MHRAELNRSVDAMTDEPFKPQPHVPYRPRGALRQWARSCSCYMIEPNLSGRSGPLKAS